MSSTVKAIEPRLKSLCSAIYAGTSNAAQKVGPWALFLLGYFSLKYLSLLANEHTNFPLNWDLGVGLCIAYGYRYGLSAGSAIFLAIVVSDYAFHVGPISSGQLLLAGTTGLITALVPPQIEKLIGKGSVIGFLPGRWAAVMIFSIPVSFVATMLQSGVVIFDPEVTKLQIWDFLTSNWIGDLSGILVVAPLTHVFLTETIAFRTKSTRQLAELMSQGVFAISLLWFVFVFNGQNVREYFYVLSLPLIWISLRHGSHGAILINSLLLLITMSFLSLIDIQSPGNDQLPERMLVLVTTALALGLTVDEARSSARRLQAREHELASMLKAGETSELTATLAHELSHPLGAISNYSAVIKHQLDAAPLTDPGLLDVVARMRQEVRRAIETVQRLREFYRSGSLRLEQLELTGAIREALALLANKLETERISVRLSTAHRPTIITADGIQIHSVLHNLLINAIEALRSVPPSRRIVAVSLNCEGNNAVISVEDSGPGVAPDILDHIFEPMATTKKLGLGLGLSMSKTIIHAHGGTINHSTSQYGGAKFYVSLPLSQNDDKQK